MHETISAWLRSLDLEQYTRSFLEHAVDMAVLPDLSDRDLETMGVLLGHRRKILRAIAGTAGARDAPLASTDPRALPAVNGAERRHLSVLFCDLVGSTQLSAGHDPEDMREIIRAFQDACAGVVARYDGFVAKFMGDGVLVYFGYPRAHEGDAERAVRAGLDMSAAVGRLRTLAGEPLQVRIGIATGLVVVGDFVGEGAAREQAVVGDPPNLAARLQALAEPGTVVLAASTRRLLGRLFDLRDLGLHVLNGLTEPVAAWAVEGIAQFQTRFESSRASGLTAFVGREAEAHQLSEAWRRAGAGKGQIVLIRGEAGIGKSRFISQFDERLPHRSCTRLRYQCSPYHISSALHPFIEQLKHAAGINGAEPAEVQRERLKAMLGGFAADVDTVAPRLAALLSITAEGAPLAVAQTAAQQRRQTLAALLDLLEGLAATRPVLVFFEDVHWADATSLEVINLAIERIRERPVLALVTCRPEFESPWSGLSNVATITLGRLDRDSVHALIGSLSGGKPLPAAVIEQIAVNTDGVPLFIEELTKAVLESGLLVEEDERFRLHSPWPSIAIPATLQDSLMARLDRLAPVRDVAQVAATIGREFSYALLHVVAGCDVATLDTALARLEEAELLFRTSPAPNARFRFKHSLIQSAAYETLLKSRRQTLHGRIADALCDRFPQVAETEPEVVAHHLSRAGLSASAVNWWSRAGARALDRSAHIEAIAHYKNAIGLADAADANTLPSERLRLQICYGQALIAAHSHGAPVTVAAFARARELVSEVADAAGQFAVYYGLWAGCHVRGDITTARAIATSMVAEADAGADLQERGLARRALGTTCWSAGEVLAARAELERAVDLHDFEQDQERGACQQFGLDPSVGTLMQLAIVLWMLADDDQAGVMADRGLALAMRTGHVPTIAYAHGWICFLLTLHDTARARVTAGALVAFSGQHALPLWVDLGTMFRGWANSQVEAGQVDRRAGLQEMRQVIASFRKQGFLLYLTFFPALLAEAEWVAGDADTALSLMSQAIADGEASGQQWYLAELYRKRAQLLRHFGNGAAAREDLLRAVSFARRQGVRRFEVSATGDLDTSYRQS